MNHNFVRLILLFTLFISFNAAGKERPPLVTKGTCDGIPQLEVKTANGYCLGLVSEGFGFPRGLLPEENGDILVVDMGSWGKKKGSLWRIVKGKGKYSKVRLLTGLDRPHALVRDPRGRIYLGSADKISIVHFEKSGVKLIDVIGGTSPIPSLPATGRHPLKQFAFDSVGNLFLNIGSASDNCEVEGESKKMARGSCKEAVGREGRGTIRRYKVTQDGSFDSQWEVYASGLRNSMGLEFDKISGRLWQVENSRDSISDVAPHLDGALLPHDELNLISKNAHYGWPYCYDMGVPSPEYPTYDCSVTTKPRLLLPPHSAPLGISFVAGGNLPGDAKRGAFVTLHGYRSMGHRIVFLPFDEQGYPEGRIVNTVWGWDGTSAIPKGAPVDIRSSPNGSIYLTDDRNGLILKLSRVR
jgi:glucose/arabinose dehydrogenase